MAGTAIKRKPQANSEIKMFHASMLVTRAEEWCVEAGSPEEAAALLARGEGHRCHLGDCLQIQLDQLHDT